MNASNHLKELQIHVTLVSVFDVFLLSAAAEQSPKVSRLRFQSAVYRAPGLLICAQAYPQMRGLHSSPFTQLSDNNLYPLTEDPVKYPSAIRRLAINLVGLLN